MLYMLDHLKQKEWQIIMDNIQIKRMSKDDIFSSIELENTHNIHILNNDILNSDLEKDNYYYIVAKKDKKVIGYAGISFILDSADLISIVVDRDYTNLGIASLMLENIYNFCKENNIKTITLEVRKSNISAQNLYTKHKFNIISIRKKYYDNIEDAIIMQKELY